MSGQLSSELADNICWILLLKVAYGVVGNLLNSHVYMSKSCQLEQIALLESSRDTDQFPLKMMSHGRKLLILNVTF